MAAEANELVREPERGLLMGWPGESGAMASRAVLQAERGVAVAEEKA